MPYKDKEKQRTYWREYQRQEKRKIYKRDWHQRNKDRSAAQQRARYAANPEGFRTYFRNHRIKKVYGLTESAYDALVAAQEGKCGICAKPTSGTWHGDRKLNVDHEHRSGRIRGLLCNRCNRALGLFGDGKLLQSALDYVRGRKSEA